jgi:hypothetical protein
MYKERKAAIDLYLLRVCKKAERLALLASDKVAGKAASGAPGKISPGNIPTAHLQTYPSPTST